MKLFITGAAGFLGRHLVAKAVQQGHTVRALVRPASSGDLFASFGDQQVEIVRADLRSSAGLGEAVRGVDAVIHAAAQKSGDLYDQIASTVVGTENLLNAMVEERLGRLVLVSTISVYDFLRVWDYERLDEESPLERRPKRRETYAQSKLLQEALVRREAQEHALELTVVRPGVIYGPDNMWTDQLGLPLGARRLLRFASFGRLPMTYVENCADAIVRCAGDSAAIGATFNIVDSDLPTRRRFVRETNRRLASPPQVIPMPAVAIRLMARAAQVANYVLFRGTARAPWLLEPAKLHVQIKSLRYSNRRIREILGWEPEVGFSEAMDRSLTPKTEAPRVIDKAERFDVKVSEGST